MTDFTQEQINQAQKAEGDLEATEMQNYHIRRIVTLRCEVNRLTAENQGMKNQLDELHKQLSVWEQDASTMLVKGEVEDVASDS